MNRDDLLEIEKLAATWLETEKSFYARGREYALHQFILAMRSNALPLVKALREALARCDTLRGLADEKAHEAGLYARRMEQAQQARRTERDEARTEVERLREVVRQVHALAAQGDDPTHGWIDPTLREIHEITKGMVE